MPSSKFTCDLPSGAPSPVVKEEHIILDRMIFDGEQLGDLLSLLTQRSQGREISGLSAYE